MLKATAPKRDRRQSAPYSYTSPLPPCKICGAKASGLHYGVNTCEACKGFFRRAIKFQKKYRCFQQQNCDVTGGRSIRTSCPFCRLQKCLSMGMAHNAIKTGRYTHAKRTENIMEVKRLECASKIIDYIESGLTDGKQIPEGLEMNALNGQFLKDKGSIVKAEGLNDEFCNIQIKHEFLDERYFSNSLYFPEKLQVDNLNFNISRDFSSFQRHIYSEHFRIEMIGIISCEIEKFLQEKTKVFPVEMKSFPDQGVSLENLEEMCAMEYIHNFEIQFPNSLQNEVIETRPQKDTEGVYISIPTPPQSSCGSSDESCFDFSFDSFEKSQIVVVSPPSSVDEDAQPSLNDGSNSSVFSNSIGFLSPASTPSLESVPSPSPLCKSSSSSGFIFTPIESSQLVLHNDSNSQLNATNVTKLFNDLSHAVKQDVSVVTEILLTAHRRDVLTLAEYEYEFIQNVQQKYIDQHQAKVEVFGLTSNYLKDDIYDEIFNHTGLDVDGRREMLFEAGKRLGNYLQSLMKFVSNIPGFACLLPEDQYTLIAAAKRGQWFLNAFAGMNKDQSIVMMPNLQVYSLSEVSWLLGSEFIRKSFDVAHHFNKANIPYEVLVVWKVVLILSTDNVDLVDAKSVSELQNIYINCLLNMTNRLKTDRPGLFAHLISLSLLLRELDHVPLSPVLIDEKKLDAVLKGHYFKAYS